MHNLSCSVLILDAGSGCETPYTRMREFNDYRMTATVFYTIIKLTQSAFLPSAEWYQWYLIIFAVFRRSARKNGKH